MIQDYNAYYFQETLEFVSNLVWNDRARLVELPIQTRLSDTTIYITGLRLAREMSNSKRYLEDLEVLFSDIMTADFSKQYQYQYNMRGHLIKRLFDYAIVCNPFIGEKEQDEFISKIRKELPELPQY